MHVQHARPYPASGGRGYAARMRRFLPCLVLLPLAACVPAPEARSPEQRSQAATAAACRAQADRVIARQDRGQLLREDERNARLGAETGSYGIRTQIDSLGRQFRRDQITQDCIRQQP